MLMTRTLPAPKLRIIWKCTAASPVTAKACHGMNYTFYKSRRWLTFDDYTWLAILRWQRYQHSHVQFSLLIFYFQNRQFFKFYMHFQPQLSKKEANSMNVTVSEVHSFISAFNWKTCNAMPFGHMVICRWSRVVIRRLKYVNANQNSRSVTTKAHTVWWRQTSDNSLQHKYLGSTFHFATAKILETTIK